MISRLYKWFLKNIYRKKQNKKNLMDKKAEAISICNGFVVIESNGINHDLEIIMLEMLEKVRTAIK